MTTFKFLPQVPLRRLTLTALLALMLVSVSAASASAETLQPWFHLSTESVPRNLSSHAGLAPGRDEVQEIVASPKAVFRLEVNHHALPLLPGFGLGSESLFEAAPIPAGFGGFAPPGDKDNIQKALEGAYGAGNVEVTGGPAGVAPLLIRSVGGDANTAVAPLEVSNEEGSTTTSVVTSGVAPQSDGELIFTAVNVGTGTSQDAAAPLRMLERLPAGLEVVYARANTRNGFDRGPVQCVVKAVREAECVFSAGSLPPFNEVEMAIGVRVQPGAHTGEVAEAVVSGGGAPSVSSQHAIAVGGASSSFGIENFELTPEEAGGAVDSQAGSHPFQLTTTLNLNSAPTGRYKAEGEEIVAPAGLAKDLTFKLPAGLIGNPTAYPRCSLSQFSKEQCPADTALGAATVTFVERATEGPRGLSTNANPVFNIEPAPGEPARFAFAPDGVPVFLDTSIRTGEDYGVTVRVANIPQTIGFVNNTVTFWGVPGDARHNEARGECLYEAEGTSHPAPCEPEHARLPPPFLALPTSCTGKALPAEVLGDSWAEPGHVVTPEPNPTVALPALDGCGLLPFGGTISAAMDVGSASTPSGLNVDVHVPQEEALNPEGLAPSDVKNITVTLPQGVALNPAAADGLGSCTQEQVGLTNANEVACPDASKVAEATIRTPLLPNPLTGFVYLASPQNFSTLSGAPQENPFASLVAMYLVVRDPVSGVLVKLPGSVEIGGGPNANPALAGLAPGQIRATFANNPQLPFEDAEVHFFGGERAPLATPARCGEYTTHAAFEPWAQAAAGEEIVHAASTFEISSGPGGSACPGAALPFSPSLSSETTNINAGAFTPLSTTLSREDGQQGIQSVTLHYPAGVSGILTGVPLCGEAQANAGTCGAGSQIGETIVSVGLGGDPFSVTGGKAYLTEKYAGAPFGLSIVNPAKAGPFDLQEGRPVVVRAKVEVDPHTAALTITTDSSGAHAIPTIIEGIPLQIKHVNVLVNRPSFTFNPTNCNPASIAGQINGAEGAASHVSVPFQVTNCAALKFAPKFAISTGGKTSKANGASLAVKLTYPKGPAGTYANIARVKVDLPKQLPSRLTTLQKACTNAQFEANPAGCPGASIIGHAKAITPLLPVPLEGPAYFVSHGGEAFPSLIIVLQGYGVTLDLVGTTFISKAGITSSTFKTVPDAPVGSFELNLPTGKYSALAANLPTSAHGSFCGQKLAMPTEFLAQNGAKINESTPVSVTGCAKKKALTRAQKLAAALKVCKKQAKRKRPACNATARKKYGPVAKKKTKGR